MGGMALFLWHWPQSFNIAMSIAVHHYGQPHLAIASLMARLYVSFEDHASCASRKHRLAHLRLLIVILLTN